MTDSTPLNADDGFKYDELDSQIVEAITCSGAYWDYEQRKAIRGLIKKHELQARVDENNRWRTILAPSDDYNTADMEDFNGRVVELKQELEKL